MNTEELALSAIIIIIPLITYMIVSCANINYISKIYEEPIDEPCNHNLCICGLGGTKCRFNID